MSNGTTPTHPSGEPVLAFFAEGRLADLSPEARAHLLERSPADASDIAARVTEIMTDVRLRGDEALVDMARRYDNVDLADVEIPAERWDAALANLDPVLRRALKRATDNIRRFHAAQLPEDVVLEVEPGVRVTRRWVPLRSVGIYAPGGLAAYPSSVLMGVVPARAAGVDEVVVCSPPAPSGSPPDAVMAACALAGADRLFAIGGAGAVAAMAWGTASVPAVDAIVGPGNRWVTEAKRQVAGEMVIDAPAGPSEVVVLADGNAKPELAATEILAQAEHDPDAACIVITTSSSTAEAIREALAVRLQWAPRRLVAAQALTRWGALLVSDTLDEAVSFIQAYAPEHLSIMTSDAEGVASRFTTAGTTFIGPWASVAFGDYLTGANHVLPTGGRARTFSGLSLHHFLRSFTVQEITEEGAASMAEDVAVLADAERLPAHGAAALARIDR